MKGIIQRSLALLALVFATLPAAQAEGIPEELQRDFIEAARREVRTTARPYHVYHWGRLEGVTGAGTTTALHGGRDERVLNYARFLKETFWRDSPSGMIAGNGFYAAIDPVASSRNWGLVHGRDKWILIQTIIPGNTPYLVIDGRLDPVLAQRMSNHTGRAFNSLKEFIVAAGSSSRLQPLRDRMVRELDVRALLYNFQSVQLSGIRSTAPRHGAFVIIDDRAMGFDRMIALTSRLPAHDPHLENRLIIQELFERSGMSRADWRGALWPELEGRKPVTDVVQWAKTHLKSCDGYLED